MAASSSISKPDAPSSVSGARLALLLMAAPVLIAAAPADPAFNDGGTVTVSRVVDGETLALSDGRILRLVDIDVPNRGALATQTKDALTKLVAGQPLALKFAGTTQDRQGRVLGELYAGDRWVQGELLKRGLARVAGTADDRTGLPQMLALEKRARRAHRGLWGDDGFAIVAADQAAQHAGSFALVTGTVAGVVSNSDGVLLYFGAARHQGFVLSLAPDVVKLCRDNALDPASLQGKTVLTRGFVDGTRRPTIAVTYPEQIEILRAKKTAPKSLSGPRQSN
jgi:micrococcal nuclease